MSAPRYPEVMFCRNDPENGHPTARVVGIDVISGDGTDTLISLEGDAAFDFDDRLLRVRVGRRWFAAKSTLARWVGNWCWDACRMHPAVLADLLNSLKRLGWEAEFGWVEIVECWGGGGAVEALLQEGVR